MVYSFTFFTRLSVLHPTLGGLLFASCGHANDNDKGKKYSESIPKIIMAKASIETRAAGVGSSNSGDIATKRGTSVVKRRKRGLCFEIESCDEVDDTEFSKESLKTVVGRRVSKKKRRVDYRGGGGGGGGEGQGRFDQREYDFLQYSSVTVHEKLKPPIQFIAPTRNSLYAEAPQFAYDFQLEKQTVVDSAALGSGVEDLSEIPDNVQRGGDVTVEPTKMQRLESAMRKLEEARDAFTRIEQEVKSLIEGCTGEVDTSESKEGAPAK